MSGTVGTGALVIMICLLGLLSIGGYSEPKDIPELDRPVERSHGLVPASMVRSHLDIRDTLFTTDSLYLDVDLARQNVTLRYRNGSTKSFLISSGNPNIREGMSTPTGIFTVQNMVPMAISRQFNDAKLHHWIGVNGGVGFHGLDGSGYYWNLGKRPSSHGCIRMAREEISEMYRLVHVGAPILVHNGEPARVVSFSAAADTVDAFVIDTATARIRGIGDDRMEALYNGELFVRTLPRLLHIAGTRVSWRIKEGDRHRIPRQVIPKSMVLPRLDEEIASR